MELVARSDDAQLQRDVLVGVHAAVEGRRRVQPPAGWDAAYAKVCGSSDAEVRSVARSLAAIYGDEQAIEEMRATLLDPRVDVAQRRGVLQSLLATGDPALAKTLQQLVTDAAVGESALTALASFDDPATPGVILEAYPRLNAGARRAAVGTLASRAGSGHQLAAAVRSGRIDKRDFTASAVRQLREIPDKSIAAFVDKTFGRARATPADKAAAIAKYEAMLSEARVLAANPRRGRAVFERTCAQCHALYGAGGSVGPDLTGSQRANLDYVLQNVVDPSALIAPEFQVTLIRTKDRRIVSGLATETAEGYRVVTETGVVVVSKTDTAGVRKSELSMMPEGLLDAMSESEVADLIAYLQTKQQVPLPN